MGSFPQGELYAITLHGTLTLTLTLTGVAVLPEVRYHVDIVRKVTGTRRELWIAREVSCNSSGTVSVL